LVMPKPIVRYFKPSGIQSLKDHFLQGIVWPIEGSKGNSYEVELHEKGFDCSCPGFTYRGECKHVRGVADRLFAERVPEYKFP